jgi:NADPH-dependent curcumin reductase CurA
VVVSTASGATGLLLCQLLKMKKCKVIGLTSAHKFETILKYVDVAVDYKDNEKLS